MMITALLYLHVIEHANQFRLHNDILISIFIIYKCMPKHEKMDA